MKNKRIFSWNLSRLVYLLLLALPFIIPQFFLGFMLLITIIGGLVCCVYIVFWIINAKDMDFEGKFDEQRVQDGIGAVIDNETLMDNSKKTASF